MVPPVGVEPTQHGVEVRCTIHYAIEGRVGTVGLEPTCSLRTSEDVDGGHTHLPHCRRNATLVVVPKFGGSCRTRTYDLPVMSRTP